MENFKDIIIQNAWGGYYVDYGLLHVQLATPILVGVILMVLIFALNKFLFQPVIRTLEGRIKLIEESKNVVGKTKSEIQKVSDEYDKLLKKTRVEINRIHDHAREEGLRKRDELLGTARTSAEGEIEKGRLAVAQELEKAKAQLVEMSKTLSNTISQRLLN